MSPLFNAVQGSFVSIAMTACFFVFVRCNKSLPRRINKVYMVATIFAFLTALAEAVYELFLGAGSVIALTLSLMFVYLMRMCAITFVMVIAFNRHFSSSALARHFMFIPGTAALIVISTLPFCDWYCRVASDGTVTFGPLRIVYIIAVIYNIVMLFVCQIRTIIYRLNGETVTLGCIIFFNSIAGILEAKYGYESVTCAAVTISLLFYYMFLHTERNSTDPLLGCYSRRYLFIDTKNVSDFALISFDVNGFKQINDIQGHDAGDKALRTICKTVSLLTDGESTRLYRMGGDEFTVLITNAHEGNVKCLVDNMRKAVEDAGYSCSWGYVMSNGDMSIDVLLDCADKMMYKEKAAYHAAHDGGGAR